MFQPRRLLSLLLAGSLLAAGPAWAQESPSSGSVTVEGQTSSPSPSPDASASPEPQVTTGSDSHANIRVNGHAAATTITLSQAEVEALKLKLIEAKPNVSISTLMSFLVPGSAQAYMGHVDRTFIMWALYLLGYTVIKATVPETPGALGVKISDQAVVGLFMVLAAGSSLDAYLLSSKTRADFDQQIDHLIDKQYPNVDATPTNR